MTDKPTGRIIRLLDDHTVVINLGAADGAQAGQRCVIYSPWDDIVDPESGESLGPYRRRKGFVVIDEVHDKFSVAATPKRREESVEEIPQSLFPFNATRTRRVTRTVQPPLDVDESDLEALPGGDEVKVGDTVEIVDAPAVVS